MPRTKKRAGMKALPASLRPIRDGVIRVLEGQLSLSPQEVNDLTTNSTLIPAWIALLSSYKVKNVVKRRGLIATRIFKVAYEARAQYPTLTQLPFSKVRAKQNKFSNALTTLKQKLVGMNGLLPHNFYINLKKSIEQAQTELATILAEDARHPSQHKPQHPSRLNAIESYVASTVHEAMVTEYSRPTQAVTGIIAGFVIGGKPLPKQRVMRALEGKSFHKSRLRQYQNRTY